MRCRRRSESVCYCPRFGKRIQKCLSFRMGSAVESKYSRPQAGERFTWPKLCSSHFWLAKTLADFEINNIAAAVPRLRENASDYLRIVSQQQSDCFAHLFSLDAY